MTMQFYTRDVLLVTLLVSLASWAWAYGGYEISCACIGGAVGALLFRLTRRFVPLGLIVGVMTGFLLAFLVFGVIVYNTYSNSMDLRAGLVDAA
jgi:hypothetical protein